MNDCEYGFAACGCAARSTTTAPPLIETEFCPTSLSEPAYIIGETDIRRIVTAMDNCRWSDVFAVIGKQRWFRDVRRGIRATRHLKPSDYIKMSERPKDMAGIQIL